MTVYYYAQGGTTVKGIAHNDSEIVDPVAAYGLGTYVIVDNYNPPPDFDDSLPGYHYPTISNAMQADSVKFDCNYRILQKVSDDAQKNINGYVADLAAGFASTGTALTTAQKNDCTTAAAIHAWIGTGTATRQGMLAASDTLISTHDMQWYLDGKWPTWDPSSAGWDAFVTRF